MCEVVGLEFIFGAEDCFHVLGRPSGGFQTKLPAQALLLEPRVVTAHVVLRDTFGF